MKDEEVEKKHQVPAKSLLVKSRKKRKHFESCNLNALLFLPLKSLQQTLKSTGNCTFAVHFAVIVHMHVLNDFLSIFWLLKQTSTSIVGRKF